MAEVADVPTKLGAYRKIIGSRIRSQLEYRLSFAMECLSQLLFTASEFVTILVLFSHLPVMGGFTLTEVALMYGLSATAFSLADLAVGHVERLPTYIREGTFDAFLMRPLGSLPQLLTSEVSLRRLGRTAQGLGILIYALVRLDLDWGIDTVALLVITPFAGAAVFSAIFIVTCSVAFWIIEGGEFANAFTYGGNLLTSYPINVFNRWVRRMLAYAIPAAFVAYFPALGILDRADPLGLPVFLQWCGPVVGVLSLCVAGLVWRIAVRHYQGASS